MDIKLFTNSVLDAWLSDDYQMNDQINEFYQWLKKKENDPHWEKIYYSFVASMSFTMTPNER